jgi:hypothetical protein
MDTNLSFYKVTEDPSSLRQAILNLRSDFDSHIHDGISSKFFKNAVANTISTNTFFIRKQTYSDTTSGFWIGIDDQNIVKMNIGDSTHFLKYDGSKIISQSDLQVNSISYLKFTIQTSFESMSGWSTSAGISNYLGALLISTTSTLNNYQYAHIPSDDEFSLAPNIAKNPIFEVVGGVSGIGTKDCFVGFGDDSADEFIGFKLTKTEVYAQWFDSNVNVYTQLLSGITPTVIRTYRCEITNNTNIKYYVDGVLKYTATWPVADINSLGKVFRASAKTTENTKIASLTLFRLLFQQDF